MKSFGKPTLVVTCSSGWAIKNLIYTGLLDRLKEKFRIVAFSQHWQRPEMRSLAIEKGLELREFVFFREHPVHKALRLLRKKLLQSVHGITTQKIIDRRTGRPWWFKVADAAVDVLAALPGSQHFLGPLEKFSSHFVPTELYRSVFDELAPALVLVASPFDAQESPFVEIASRRDIGLCTFIPSWDNPSSKGVISTAYDRIFVWSERQRAELHSYYPTLEEGKIRVVGIPQFDIYAQPLPPEAERTKLLSELGVPVDAQVILYSTGPAILTPDEGDVMLDIVDFIRAQAPVRKLHLMVRMHPHDSFDRFAELNGLAEVTLTHPSRKDEGNMYAWIPPRDELALLAGMLKASEVCVNLASTMVLDATAAGVPCINVYYDGRKTLSPWMSIRRFYETTHYVSVVKIGAAPLASDPLELAHHLNEALANKNIRRELRDELLVDQAGFPPGSAVDRIASEISSFLPPNSGA